MRKRKPVRVTVVQQELRMIRERSWRDRINVVLVSEHGFRARVNLSTRIRQLEDDMNILFSERY